MGMSASQARFLCLTARKNNVEFEGQQINQQRTSLSNESGNYYSELCNLNVPTPPCVDDYTKVTYTFDDGALTNTITSMIAKGEDKYSISYIQQWQDDYSIVSAASSVISKTTHENEDKTTSIEYKIGSAVLRKLGAVDTELDADKLTDPYLKTLTVEQRKELEEQESYYKEMLDAKFGQAGQDYYVRYIKDNNTGNYVPYMYRAAEVEEPKNYNNDLSVNINCYTLGSTTKTKEVLNKEGVVEKDSTGRYISVTIIEKDGAQITYNLTTNTITDEDAYNDAMNNYNYKQHQYNQKVQDINSKIEIIQQQDKRLELQLKHLDTEETAISTELEAVKKVISKNVDSSFKTFNA